MKEGNYEGTDAEFAIARARAFIHPARSFIPRNVEGEMDNRALRAFFTRRAAGFHAGIPRLYEKLCERSYARVSR